MDLVDIANDAKQQAADPKATPAQQQQFTQLFHTVLLRNITGKIGQFQGVISAQTPTGSFFNGNSSQLGNSLRSVTFFLAAAMIIAGIIFIAYGIITSGLKESLSTWKFITGAACFAFGGVCAAVYAFSQGDSVPLDNTF